MSLFYHFQVIGFVEISELFRTLFCFLYLSLLTSHCFLTECLHLLAHTAMKTKTYCARLLYVRRTSRETCKTSSLGSLAFAAAYPNMLCDVYMQCPTYAFVIQNTTRYCAFIENNISIHTYKSTLYTRKSASTPNFNHFVVSRKMH